MTTMRVLLLALLSMMPPAQSAAPPAVGRIAGVVVEESTKKPVAGARVMLLPISRPGGGSMPQAMSDASGRFVFEELAPGRYALQVTKGGFAGTAAMGRPDPIDVTAGTNIDTIVYALQRGGAISGRVVDASGEPVVEVRLNAQRVVGGRGMPVANGAVIQTNDLGEYRIYGLAPGDYYVQAGGSVVMSPQAVIATQMAPTYFPSARDVRGASVVSVTAGQTASNVDIRMEVEPLFKVRGIVVDQQGAPVAGAIVSVTPEQRSPAMMGPMGRIRSQADGSFVIPSLAAGGYTVGAAVPLVVTSPSVGGGGAGGAAGVGAVAAGNFTSISSGLIGGGSGGGIASSMETRDGVTTSSQWRVDSSQDVRVSVEDRDVTGVRVIALPPPAAR